MIYFHNDYNRMCHPAVLERMQEALAQGMPGYGEDPCCGAAADKIRKLCAREDAAVHFLVGGTQTNLTVIAAALRPHQAVIAAESGHIHVHETGAIEATGHKVIALPAVNGKITAEQVNDAVCSHWADPDHVHIAQPKLVYISQSTEWGTLYSLSELEAISRVCREHGLFLFVDGARLGYALTAKENDVTLADLARLCDVFYIGGTKCGTMFGEAVVITNPSLMEDFRYLIKQRGAMLAKGWLLGIQFEALLEDGLMFDICRKANAYADQIRATVAQLGYPLSVPGCTNQIFPVLPNALLEKLKDRFTFVSMEPVGQGSRVVRFCTSWATSQADVDDLCEALAERG